MNVRGALTLASAAFVVAACATQGRGVVLLAAAPETSASPNAPSLCANTSGDICLVGCPELASRLAPSVAPRVIACLRGAHSGETCVPPAAYACVENALPTTRRDPRAEADCDRLAQRCHGKKAAPDWRRNCSTVFPSLTPRGRSAVIACMAARDCEGMPYFDDDVGSCVYEDVPA